ncbi:MAG: hypothetical protein PHS79_02205 [Patescibacteria group bacterium]|nr:hypothetical protein [Patescibacteria group bacterium]
MQKPFILALSLMALLGAGCASQTPQTRLTPKTPTLNLLSPGLYSTTTASKLNAIGETDANVVYLGETQNEVKDGKFDIELDIKEGKNEFPLSVGNGIVTSTMTIVVDKVAEQVTTKDQGLKTDDEKSKTNNKINSDKRLPGTTDLAVTPKAADSSVPVSFSDTEMHLTISQSQYGAELSWGKAVEPFQSYVLVKSETDPSLYFPKVFWFKAITSLDTRSWTDKDLKSGKTYYRVCKIKPDQSVTCGNVAYITKQ